MKGSTTCSSSTVAVFCAAPTRMSAIGFAMARVAGAIRDSRGSMADRRGMGGRVVKADWKRREAKAVGLYGGFASRHVGRTEDRDGLIASLGVEADTGSAKFQQA